MDALIGLHTGHSVYDLPARKPTLLAFESLPRPVGQGNSCTGSVTDAVLLRGKKKKKEKTTPECRIFLDYPLTKIHPAAPPRPAEDPPQLWHRLAIRQIRGTPRRVPQKLAVTVHFHITLPGSDLRRTPCQKVVVLPVNSRKGKRPENATCAWTKGTIQSTRKTHAFVRHGNGLAKKVLSPGTQAVSFF